MSLLTDMRDDIEGLKRAVMQMEAKIVQLENQALVKPDTKPDMTVRVSGVPYEVGVDAIRPGAVFKGK